MFSLFFVFGLLATIFSRIVCFHRWRNVVRDGPHRDEIVKICVEEGTIRRREVSLQFSFRFSERSARGRASSGEAAKREKREWQPENRKEPLPSSAFRHSRGHFCVSSVSLEGRSVQIHL